MGIQERFDVTGWTEEQIQTRMGSILNNYDFDFQNWLIRYNGSGEVSPSLSLRFYLNLATKGFLALLLP